MKLCKGNSGVKNKGTPVAKTIAEANALAVRLGIADRADFTGIDISHANMLIQRLVDIRQQFPQLPQLEYIGRNIGKSSKVIAWCQMRPEKGKGYVPKKMILNQVYASAKKPPEKFNEYMTSKWWPVGCNSFKSVIDHEIGHYLDYSFSKSGLRADKQIARLFSLYGGKKEKIMRNNVSEYASKKTTEFIAECWAEYCNNPNPRAAAKAVGERIIELYKAKGAN